MKFSKFIKECQEHNVLKNLSIYVVSSWVLLQVIDLISGPLGFSNQVVAYVLILLLIGLPLYIFGIWKYKLATSIKRKPVTDSQGEPVPGKFRRSGFQKIYFFFLALISLICLGIALFIVNTNFVRSMDLPSLESDDKIAVLEFKNLTGDPENDLVGKMAVDWIIHGVTRNKLGQVISPEIIADYSKVLRASLIPTEDNRLFSNYLKPSRIVEGEYYLANGQLIFQCAIMDGSMNRSLISFEPVSCQPDSPLDCIEALNQRIQGYFVNVERKEESLEEHPPKYEAYKLFNLAKQWRYEDDRKYLDLLNQAIAADTTFFEPKIYRFMHYFNRGAYRKADSLLTRIKLSAGLFPRQRNLLNVYDALLQGNHRNTYRYQKEEYKITPLHLETNSNMMIFTLQLVNKPQGVDSIFREVEMGEMDLSQCDFCTERYKIKAMSDIELGDYPAAIALLQQFEDGVEFGILKKILLRAHIRKGDFEKARSLLSRYADLFDPSQLSDIRLFAAKEFIIAGRQDLADTELSEILSARGYRNAQADSTALPVIAESLFYKGEYQEAETVLEELTSRGEADFYFTSLLAACYHKNAEPQLAAALIADLESRKGPYQFGEVPYSLGQYYAITGDAQRTYQYLLRAIAEGHWYETGAFRNDPLLKNYINTDTFSRIRTFWH